MTTKIIELEINKYNEKKETYKFIKSEHFNYNDFVMNYMYLYMHHYYTTKNKQTKNPQKTKKTQQKQPFSEYFPTEIL